MVNNSNPDFVKIGGQLNNDSDSNDKIGFPKSECSDFGRFHYRSVVKQFGFWRTPKTERLFFVRLLE